ncbi:hypothetical protein Pint_05950 [Pistacia integerrima]|uniref:Uncharacterized protein n=1 Tax=Pistacia integerrima TaxID=434235 RepID=A0ACC0Z509_9ROSI|nr:hypothetical protein Pint_05950 [Pistacia integerrima]
MSLVEALDSQSNNKEPINVNELPKEAQNVLAACKSERRDECPSLCVLNTQAALPLLQYKRRRQNDSGSNRSNGSDNSTGTGHDPSSSTTTTAETTMTNAATTTAISALLEFSLMESIEPPKENPPALGTTFGADGFDSSVPPSCVKLIKDLQKQVHKTAVERETLKLEMMSAQAMINILQSRIDYLSKENEDLKRRI